MGQTHAMAKCIKKRPKSHGPMEWPAPDMDLKRAWKRPRWEAGACSAMKTLRLTAFRI